AKLQLVTPDIAEGLGLKRPQGALVAGVSANGPAARAGLKSGDVITHIDGQPVEDPNAFDYRFGTKPVGGNARITALRGGREVQAEIALRTAPQTPREDIVLRARSPLAGATVGNLSPALADELRLDPSAEGVVILDVANGSPAQQLGFRRGDIVTTVNDRGVAKSRDLEQATGQPSRIWRIVLIRGGQRLAVQFGG
ncbi:MAG: serine protease, partial [Alphaproteobacteria bacterium]|nr:serine protease [Alphaproteobacteria bacterium]